MSAPVDVMAVIGRACDAAAEASELMDGCPDDDVMEAASTALSEAGARLSEARAAVAELIEADKEYDAAKDALAAAKREKGNWRVNPLGHNHTAVIRSREATARRSAALARVQGVQS